MGQRLDEEVKSGVQKAPGCVIPPKVYIARVVRELEVAFDVLELSGGRLGLTSGNVDGIGLTGPHMRRCMLW